MRMVARLRGTTAANYDGVVGRRTVAYVLRSGVLNWLSVFAEQRLDQRAFW